MGPEGVLEGTNGRLGGLGMICKWSTLYKSALGGIVSFKNREIF